MTYWQNWRPCYEPAEHSPGAGRLPRSAPDFYGNLRHPYRRHQRERHTRHFIAPYSPDQRSGLPGVRQRISYIDRLCDLAMEPGMCVCTFGDLLRVQAVPGVEQCMAVGGRVQMVYSPLEVLSLAKAEPGTRFVFAAVGFETTAPVYAVLADTIMKEQIPNVQLLTALKTMPPAVRAYAKAKRRLTVSWLPAMWR